jgi:hypothetical protein
MPNFGRDIGANTAGGADRAIPFQRIWVGQAYKDPQGSAPWGILSLNKDHGAYLCDGRYLQVV